MYCMVLYLFLLIFNMNSFCIIFFLYFLIHNFFITRIIFTFSLLIYIFPFINLFILLFYFFNN